MPPRREDPEIARLVSEQILATLPNIVSQIAAGLNANPPNQPRGGANQERECTYKTFRTCNPKEFHGTEGAVGLLTWIEGMESVLHISKCSEANKVEFAACLLQGRALTWWNTQVQTRGREAANRITWEEFKLMLSTEYCPRSEMQKLEAEFWNHVMIGSEVDKYTVRFHELAKMVPHLVTPEENKVDRYIWGLAPEIRGDVTSGRPKTLQEAVELATKLTNNAVRSGLFTKDGVKGKRRVEESSRRPGDKRKGKEQRIAGNYGIQAQPTDKGKEVRPRCVRCNNQHQGECIICRRCNKGGHHAKDCRTRGRRVCYECGSPNHYRNDCPRVNRRPNTNQVRPENQGDRRDPVRGRVFEIGLEEARRDPEVIAGTFFLNNHPATVLFDSGADRSFMSLEFSSKVNPASQKLKKDYVIEYANGHEVRVKDVFPNCTLTLAKKEFKIDLIPVRLGSFDIVVGMDWLSKSQAEIKCSEKTLRIPLPGGEVLIVPGERSGSHVKVVSCMKMHK